MSDEKITNAGGGTGAQAGAATQRTGHEPASTQTTQPDYVHVGMEFRDWFNSKLAQIPNPAVTLGTKQAHAVKLHPDGRLECTLVGGEGDGEKQFVAFEPQYLDQLVRKIAAIGL